MDGSELGAHSACPWVKFSQVSCKCWTICCLKHWTVCSIRLRIKNPVTIFSRIAGLKTCSFVGSTWLGRTAPASLGRYSCSLSDPHPPDYWASVSFPWLLFLTYFWNCKYFLYAYPYEVKMNGRQRLKCFGKNGRDDVFLPKWRQCLFA